MELVQQIGSYAGFAAIIGLAILSALYFSQARDVRRLREWAGRAPERSAQEAERQADATGSNGAAAPAAVAAGPSQGPAAGQTVAAAPSAAASGTVAAASPAAASATGATPPEASAPAQATSTTTATAQPAAAASVQAVSAPAAPGQAGPPPVAAAAGDGSPPVPTPPVRAAGASSGPGAGTTPPRVAPRPSPIVPLGGAPAPRRRFLGLAPRYLALVLGGLLVIGGGVAAAVLELRREPAPAPVSPAPTPASQRPARVVPSTVTVSVLNGTTVPGLARQVGARVRAGGFRLGTVTNASEQQQAESAVLYGSGAREEALAVARRLGISQIQESDPGSVATAGNAPVTVIVGADQVP